MSDEPTTEQLIKEALADIYNLSRIDGLLIIAVASGKGVYNMKGRLLGSPTNRMRMIAQSIHKSALEFNMNPNDLIRLLNGLMAEAEFMNRSVAKEKKPASGSGGTTFTITKM